MNKIGHLLFSKIFLGYIIIAVTLTGLQIMHEYHNHEKRLILALDNIEKIITQPLLNAVWNLDEYQIKNNTESIILMDDIIGISIIDPENTLISQYGTVEDSEKKYVDHLSKKNEVLYSSNLLKKTFPLIYKEQSSEVLGTVTLYTSYDKIYDSMKEHIFIIILSAMLKSLALFLLFLYFSNKIITKPLESLIKAVRKTKNKHYQHVDTDILNIHKDTELKILFDSYNDMQERIEQLNQGLELRVKNEVAKNRKKDQVMFHQSRLAQMGEMLSMIAHQWRQPLAAISATSASIELKAAMHKLDNEDIEEKAQAISDYSQHLSRTIDDFRGFFKPNNSKTETTYDEIINSVLQIMETSLENKNIPLIKTLNCHENFHTYSNELKQVILNLITNAEEALLETMVEEPCIKIETYTKDDQYILEISDNAGGIPKEHIDHIFDPYFSTKKAKDGTGLGLYMSKIIIEEHCGGTLNVINIKEGALFSILLNKNTKVS